MTSYYNYIDLVQSYFDINIYNLVFVYNIPILLLIVSRNGFIFFTLLFIRTFTFNFWLKRIFGWVIIIYYFLTNSWMYITFLLTIEAIREFFIFGVPLICYFLSENMSVHLPTEIIVRRLLCWIKFRHHGNPVSIIDIMNDLYSLIRTDSAKALTSDERGRLKDFLKNIVRTRFLIKESTFVVMFSSFIVHISGKEFQIMNDDTMKLMKKSTEDEICPVCQQSYRDYIIELRCKHKYCYECIFKWFSEQLTCPTCRDKLDDLLQ